MSGTVIVGASVAGVRTAQALRSQGYSGAITIVDAEEEWPYDKPALSKSFLSGQSHRDSLELISKTEAASLEIELLLGTRAIGLDVAEKLLEVDRCVPIAYDSLVIATGGRARPSPWGQPEGVHVLRTLDDARKLHNDLSPGAHLAVVGAGFIGAEVASTARAANVEVTLIDPLPYPMSRVMTPEVGDWFSRLHEAHGVTTRFGVGVESIDGGRGNFALKLTDGTEVRSDSVLVGIGSMPNDEWLTDSGLLIDNGVLCDEFCRAIQTEGIYVAGDAARLMDQQTGPSVRLEHWTNAVEQAKTVAHNIVNPGDAQIHQSVEYVWSDQYDWRIQVAGRPSHDLDQVTHGDPFVQGRAAAIFVKGGALRGAVVVNWPRVLIEARKAIARKWTAQELNDRIESLTQSVSITSKD
ncbi:NAD(P)/FAD-dependent oxidoreductase [Nesterenkonia sphaerica]|uniref:NAD(P)/FAD-dependent oxidoreductase n=1 Tax=Nesterenkonia sphaerica TaxID=1804988 RepID=A0A5R8ZXS5_9MICC|nr:FAD/NAD(P)-binding oxidoreductase [Nesterenkonia sphaerica]TLP71212.1 NAD(P)/FAD-dependent oxidoreductase [Nesterenkonia sphaerica]